MNNIVLLVGPSGTGKSTIAEIAEMRFGKRQVVSHTTRPMRYPGEEGHYFVAQEEFDEIREDLVAYTKFCGYEYGATRQVVEESDIYVIDPAGVRYFLDSYTGSKEPIVVILTADEKTCEKRMLERGDSQQDVKRRLQNDRETFSNLSFSCRSVKLDVQHISPRIAAEAIVRMFLLDSSLAQDDIPVECGPVLTSLTRQIYEPGTRIRLLQMLDKHSPPSGSTATVEHIDGLGQLWCQWDKFSCGLAVIPGVDMLEAI